MALLQRTYSLNRMHIAVTTALLVLVLGRLLLQLLLYRAGFQALTADDFGRTFMAARWSESPYLRWYGPWLPFHMYIVGAALWVHWELLIIPRAINIVLGAVSLIVMYRLTWNLFECRRTALVSALLLTVNPAHTWLSSTSLTELPHLTLVLTALLCFVRYLKQEQSHTLVLGALALGIANGFRIESWLFSVLFSLYFVGYIAQRIISAGVHARDIIHSLMILALVWVVPVLWVLGNYIETGDAFWFLTIVTHYKDTLFDSGRSYMHYLYTFIHIDPYATFLVVVGIVLCVLRYHHSHSIVFFVIMVVLPFILFCALHRGRIEWPPNVLRYLAPFLCITYPVVAFAIVQGIRALTASSMAQSLLLVVTLSSIVTYQANATMQFTNDPAVPGLAVGQRIRELREEQAHLAQRPVLIELVCWHYLAIHVGANDITDIVYDRPHDMQSCNSPSILQAESATLRTCLYTHDIAYVVVWSSPLHDFLEHEVGLIPSEEVNEYRFYLVPDHLVQGPVNVEPPCFFRFK